MKKRGKIIKISLLILLASLILGAGAALAYPEFFIKDDAVSNKTASDISKTANQDAANPADTNKAEDQKADEAFKQAEQKNQQLEADYQNGFNLFHSFKYQEAIDIERKIIAEDPTFYKAYSVLGIALCYNGQYDEGMKNIDKSLELKSDYGYGIFNKALANELYGHYDIALEWYHKALSVENYVWSYYGIASIYGRRGDVDNTVKYLSEAIKLNPAVKDVAKGEKDFNNVRGKSAFEDLLK